MKPLRSTFMLISNFNRTTMFHIQRKSVLLCSTKVSAQLPKLEKAKKKEGVLDFFREFFWRPEKYILIYLIIQQTKRRSWICWQWLIVSKAWRKTRRKTWKTASLKPACKLILRLAADNKSEDIIRIAKDDEYLENVQKYGILRRLLPPSST